LRTLILIIAVAVVTAACSSSGDTGTTTTAVTTTGDGTGTTAAEATTTTAAASTTTAAPASSTTTTTEASASPVDAQALVDAKTAAAAAAAPDDWEVEEQENDSFEEADFTYEPCLGPDDFDLDALDPATLAVKEVRATAPSAQIPFGMTTAVVEARVFESADTAADVFAVIERIYGTDEGRQCMSEIVTALIGEEAPIEAGEITVETLEVEGADVGARTTFTADIQGLDFAFTIDLVASRDGACTVVATFISFGEEFPADVADAMMSAATSV